MAILISSIALFGLSLFDIQQRYREIAIRKVHGATHKEIYCYYSKIHYHISNVIFDCHFYILLGNNHLSERFAYKANISSWLFIIAAIIISLISILTLVYQVKRLHDRIRRK